MPTGGDFFFCYLLLYKTCRAFLARQFLVIRFHGVQPLDLGLNLIDAVAPRLVFSVQFNRIIRIRLACFLVLRVLLCFVIVAVKLRL